MSEYVTQADREATVRLFGITEWIAEEYRSGKRDNTYEVLAFADHRHASLAADLIKRGEHRRPAELQKGD
jgi:hypothetical protein